MPAAQLVVWAGLAVGTAACTTTSVTYVKERPLVGLRADVRFHPHAVVDRSRVVLDLDAFADGPAQSGLVAWDPELGTAAYFGWLPDGSPPTLPFDLGAVTADLRYMVFSSDHGEFMPDVDVDGERDFFWMDNVTGEVRLLTPYVRAPAFEGRFDRLASLSSDGMQVSIFTRGELLAEMPVPGCYTYNALDAGFTYAALDEAEIPVECSSGVATADRRYFIFGSTAAVNGIDDDVGHLFRRDQETGNIMLVDRDGRAGGASGEGAVLLSASEDGRYVLFGSSSPDLVAGDHDGLPNLFVRDMERDRSLRVDDAFDGGDPVAECNCDACYCGLDAPKSEFLHPSGRWVAFTSPGENLVPLDGDERQDVFLRDVWTRRTLLISQSVDGVPASDWIEDDIGLVGDRVYFWTTSRLHPGDRDDARDLYVHRPATCRGLPATLLGTYEDDVLVGTEGDDVILALAGDDVVDGLGGDDVICGGEGADTLYGREGDDTLVGGPHDDLLEGGEGVDVLDGGLGEDRLRGGPEDTCEAGALEPGQPDVCEGWRQPARRTRSEPVLRPGVDRRVRWLPRETA